VRVLSFSSCYTHTKNNTTELRAARPSNTHYSPVSTHLSQHQSYSIQSALKPDRTPIVDLYPHR